jgi:hypothetical protein
MPYPAKESAMEMPTQGYIRVYIRDHLAADQVSEDVRVVVDSQEAGLIALDQQHTASVIPVELAASGRHSYVLEVDAMVRKDGGRAERQHYVGRGTFLAMPEQVFRLAADRTAGDWTVHLEPDRDELEIDQ